MLRGEFIPKERSLQPKQTDAETRTAAAASLGPLFVISQPEDGKMKEKERKSPNLDRVCSKPLITISYNFFCFSYFAPREAGMKRAAATKTKERAGKVC